MKVQRVEQIIIKKDHPKFKIIDDMFIEIQHFNETPIKSVFFNNPLPLPYLYNQLYNK